VYKTTPPKYLIGFLPVTYERFIQKKARIQDNYFVSYCYSGKPNQEESMEQQIVVFELANEHYGLDISTVEGIIKMQSITKMPQAPNYVEGITNLRGSVVPVMDLRRRFGLATQERTKDTRIVVVYINSVKVGMIVDGVSQVLRIQDDTIEPPPPMVTTINSAFIKGIAKLDNQLVILLDLTKVLSIEEKAELVGMPAV
jgi:purine-binding chemotaxis protein CheW